MMNNMNQGMMNNNMNPGMMNNMNQGMMNNMNQAMMNNMNQGMMNNMNQAMMNNMAQMQNYQMMMNQMNGGNQTTMKQMAENQQNSINGMINQIQNQDQQNNPQHQSENISIKFCSTHEGLKTISVPCTLNDKMKDVIDRYWSKVGKPEPPKVRYIFGTKDVILTLTIAENGIRHGMVIQVILTENVKGAK